MRKELLLSLVALAPPIRDEDHSTRVEALILDLLLAIPALKPEASSCVEGRRHVRRHFKFVGSLLTTEHWHGAYIGAQPSIHKRADAQHAGGTPSDFS